MYLYDNDALGDYPQTLGPGIDPIGSQRTMCPLLRQDGHDLAWLDYVLRTASPDDPLSRYKKFLNEVAYRAYLESCKGDSIDELKKHLKLFPWSRPDHRRHLPNRMSSRAIASACPRLRTVPAEGGLQIVERSETSA